MLGAQVEMPSTSIASMRAAIHSSPILTCKKMNATLFNVFRFQIRVVEDQLSPRRGGHF